MPKKSWATSELFREKMVAEYAPVANSNQADQQLPEFLANWLSRLRLLYGVPFNYLVPNSKMLPKESIRFFYLDRNWTDRLVDGALSVGKTSTREYTHHHAMKNVIDVALNVEERAVRPKLRGINPSRPVSTSKQSQDTTGLLLRSAVVSGWAGLEIKAYRTLDDPRGIPTNKLKLLRMDRLAPDVLLCFFDGIPRVVDIEEPYEGLQFGVDVDNETGRQYEIQLRNMQGNEAGSIYADASGERINITVPVRTADKSVIHIGALVSRIESTIQTETPLRDQLKAELIGGQSTKPISSAEFAVQMLRFPYIQRFFKNGQTSSSEADWSLASIYHEATFVARVVVDLPGATEEEGLISHLSKTTLKNVLGHDDDE